MAQTYARGLLIPVAFSIFQLISIDIQNICQDTLSSHSLYGTSYRFLIEITYGQHLWLTLFFRQRGGLYFSQFCIVFERLCCFSLRSRHREIYFVCYHTASRPGCIIDLISMARRRATKHIHGVLLISFFFFSICIPIGFPDCPDMGGLLYIYIYLDLRRLSVHAIYCCGIRTYIFTKIKA